MLQVEKELSKSFAPDAKYGFEPRNGQVIRQYSTQFTKAYNQRLNGMVERRMRQAIFAVASFWFTAWADAGQPSLKSTTSPQWTTEDQKEWEALNEAWKKGGALLREHE